MDSEEEKTNLEEGAVVLRWPKKLSQDSVEELDYWIQGVLRRARRKALYPGLAPFDGDCSRGCDLGNPPSETSERNSGTEGAARATIKEGDGEDQFVLSPAHFSRTTPNPPKQCP
jgi:hypothetical protein